MIDLTSKQRKVLERCAQNLQSVVIVGDAGVTSNVEAMTREMLRIHELIKISFNQFKDEKKLLAEKLAHACGATLVRIIGNKAILYKASDERDKQKYEKLL